MKKGRENGGGKKGGRKREKKDIPQGIKSRTFHMIGQSSLTVELSTSELTWQHATGKGSSIEKT